MLEAVLVRLISSAFVDKDKLLALPRRLEDLLRGPRTPIAVQF
jgi:hypothetical protein